ncbi:MAG: PsiF family protein [Rhodanobacter sp.]
MSISLRMLVASAAFTIAGASFAATGPAPAKVHTMQQQRMADCNRQATGKKGDERKTFMSSCLKDGGSIASPARMQQNKMKTCNADAKTKAFKGAERKAFMSHCLKGKTSA